MKQEAQTTTLTEELATFGEVRDGGCLLKTDGVSYVMCVSRNVAIKHTLACAYTDNDRLEAHWKQFVAAVRGPALVRP